MARATLTGPNRLMIHNTIFEKGVPTPVPTDIARFLEADVRFEVEFDDEDEAAVQDEGAGDGETEPAKLTNEQKMEAIRDAVANLDPDDESNWTKDGKPDARALTKLLKFQVTSAERDKALGAPSEEKKGNIVIRRKAEAGAGEPIDTGTGEGGAEGDDPSTAGGVTV